MAAKLPIKTYVIGFAVSTVDAGQPAPVDCSKISSKGTGGSGDTFDPKGLCGASMDPKLATCCTLAKIAFYGGSTNAYFVSNATELRAAMAAILRDIDAKVSTRTMPVFAGASNDSLGGAYSFFSSFRADQADVWSGVLERQRTKCVPETSGTSTIIKPTNLPIDPALGDKFSENVAAADSSHPRTFYTVHSRRRCPACSGPTAPFVPPSRRRIPTASESNRARWSAARTAISSPPRFRPRP